MAETAAAPSVLPGGLNLDTLIRQAQGGPSASYVKPTIAKVKDIQARKEAETGPLIEDLQKKINAGQQEVHTKYEGVSPLEVKPWTQPLPEGNFLQDFGSAASVFAQLASAFTRTPMRNALNAAAATMKAGQERDLRNYQLSFKAWQENNNLAIQRHEAQHQDYMDAMNLLQTDINAGQAALKTVAAKYGDEQAATLVEAGLYKDLDSVLQARQQKAMQLLHLAPELTKMGQQQQILLNDPDWLSGDPQRMQAAYQRMTLASSPYAAYSLTDPKKLAFNTWHADFVKEHGREPTGTEMREFMNSGAGTHLSETALDQMADQYLAGDQSVLSGLGYGTAGAANRVLLREKIAAKMQERGKTGADMATTVAEFQGLKAGERAVGTRIAQVALPVAEAKKLIPLALDASRAFGRTGFVPLNRAYQEIARGSGDTKIARFVAANNTLINVYARAVSPVGAPTVSDKDHARELLETAMTPDQYEAVVDQLGKEMDAAQKAPAEVRREFREAGMELGAPRDQGAAPSDQGWSVEKVK